MAGRSCAVADSKRNFCDTNYRLVITHNKQPRALVAVSDLLDAVLEGGVASTRCSINTIQTVGKKMEFKQLRASLNPSFKLD